MLVSRIDPKPFAQTHGSGESAIGRIERTLFTLEWLQSPDLRRRVQVGLNKGEAKNALARAVFFNRLGEMRDRTFENQRYRASGLNLVVAAIILWNTVYLERAIRLLQQKDKNISDDLLVHLSPLGWEHINLMQMDREVICVALLDARFRLLKKVRISVGTLNESIAHPREILKAVICHSAYGFVLAHNHPSGDPHPSDSDIRLTNRLRDAALLLQIRFLDHIIIGQPIGDSDPYFSFKQAGLL